MAQISAEYRRWTGFVSADLARKFPVYLFAHSDDFYAAGGPQNASGAFIGNALLAVWTPGDWHILQHEGFHQFVAAAPGHALPSWVEEGWAEYFGESLFTGDGYVSGVIPGWRLRRLKSEIVNHRLKSLSELIGLSPQKWNDELALANYDQAWALVQFFLHGAKGRYRFAFAAFIDALRSGELPEKAWAGHFPDTILLEAQWRDEWLGLSDDPTRNLYAQVAVATLSGYLGRAIEQGQRFESFAEFSRAADSQSLRTEGQDWLPPSLAREAVATLRGMSANGSIQAGSEGLSSLVVILPDQVRIVGTFVLRGERVKRVDVEIVTISDRAVPPVPLLRRPPGRNAE